MPIVSHSPSARELREASEAALAAKIAAARALRLSGAKRDPKPVPPRDTWMAPDPHASEPTFRQWVATHPHQTFYPEDWKRAAGE